MKEMFMESQKPFIPPFRVFYPSSQYADNFMFFAWDIFLNTQRWAKRKSISGPTVAKMIQPDSPEEARVTFEAYKRTPGLFLHTAHPQVLFAENHFPDQGGFSRNEIIALVDLQYFFPPGQKNHGSDQKIFPSEATFPKKALNRKRLREALQADVEQVLMLYSEPENRLNRLLNAHIPEAGQLIKNCNYYPGYQYNLYGFSGKRFLEEFEVYFREAILTVGDGNHRTLAAKMMSVEHPEIPLAHWLMVSLVNLHDPNFRTAPIHRIVQNQSTDFLSNFRPFVREEACENFSDLMTRFEKTDDLCTMAVTDGKYFRLLFPKPSFLDELKSKIDPVVPVHVLNAVLEPLAIDRNNADIDTEIEIEDAYQKAVEENGTYAFFLKPIPKSILEEGFNKHLLFPEKSFSIIGKSPGGGPMWFFGDEMTRE